MYMHEWFTLCKTLCMFVHHWCTRTLVRLVLVSQFSWLMNAKNRKERKTWHYLVVLFVSSSLLIIFEDIIHLLNDNISHFRSFEIESDTSPPWLSKIICMYVVLLRSASDTVHNTVSLTMKLEVGMKYFHTSHIT